MNQAELLQNLNNMSIKSKKWYENQIRALENAAKNEANLALPVTEFMNKSIAEQSFRENKGVRDSLSNIYSKLNQLRAEYSLYYR